VAGTRNGEQPIQFNHKAHVGKGLDCAVCHRYVRAQPFASLPALRTCLMCHSAKTSQNPEEGKIREFTAKKEPLQWVRIYRATCLGGPAEPGEGALHSEGVSHLPRHGGVGGKVGPDLTAEGGKPGRDLKWHIKHFRNPAAVVPGSIMPPLADLSEDDLTALAAYMLSLK